MSAKYDDCPGDNCPTLAEDTETQDVVVQLYALDGAKAAETDVALGPVPPGEVRGVMPAKVFEQLVAQRAARVG
ncbi:hypothetical protein [Actinomycetospora soli]|uniref:hypothetical protein n=1 Tax=Actinomycetospora soli TaxID=2893887 RepID=UPI001E533B01|nr:hypothetical protein [Actinomycetospora soli]MCD2191600.1 hypothetical protein [Actinomycetospora soli]